MMSSLASVDALVAAFHHQCRFKPAFNSKFDYKLEHLAHDSTVPISDYCRTCDHYGLPMFRQSIQSNDGRMLVYQARLFMAVGWLKVFFNDDPKLNGIRDLVMDGLSFLVPRTELKEYQKFLVDVVFPKGLYAENTWFSPHHLEDPHKERDDRISKLAEQAQKRAQKLQEKRNAKKKKEVAPAIPQNPPAQVVPVAQNPKEEEEEEKVEFDLQKFVAEQGLVYDEKSGKFVYEKDLEQVEELDEPASPEDAQDEQNENKSRKKNRRRKKRSPVAEVEGTVEDPEPIVHVEPEPQEPELPQPEEVPPEPENPPAAPKDPTKQSNSCPKCLRASDKCKKAISEAAASKKKADKFETKANRTDEVEKKLKEMEQEMGRMRIQLATHLIHSEENAKLRLKISNREVIEEQLRTSRREISLKNELLENENQVLKEKLNKMELAATKTAEETLEKDEKIAELEKSVDELTIKTHTQFEERAQLEELITRKKHELLLKNRACSKLQSENEVLTRRVENLENENEKLRNSAPGPSNQSEILELNRKKLIELRKMKDDFGKNKVLEEANQMMERLKTLPIDPDSLEAAESELLQLESFIENYKDFLDLNARIFQKTNNPSKLLQLPEYPKLSDDFLEIYSKPFPIVPPITGVPDTDCLICHEYREPDQEVQACTNCPYIYHLECLKDWFKEKPGQTTCPQCQHTLRDPQEYPELK